MPKRVINILFGLGFLACVALLAIASRTSRSTAIALAVLAVVSLPPLFLWKLAADKRADRKQAERDAARILELREQIYMYGKPLVIEGSSGLWIPAALVVPIALAMLLFERTPELSVGITVLLGMVMMLTFLDAWPLAGKPALTIKREGLNTPTHGFFEWSEIDGMGLTRITALHSPDSHTLDLHGMGIGSRRRKQVHPALKLRRKLIPFTRRRPDAIEVRLASTSETSDVIHQVCRDVWIARTGRNAVWVNAMRDEDFQHRRQQAERLAQIRFAGEVERIDLAPHGVNSLDKPGEQRSDTLERQPVAAKKALNEDEFVRDLWGSNKVSVGEWQRRAEALARESARAGRSIRVMKFLLLLVLVAGVGWAAWSLFG